MSDMFAMLYLYFEGEERALKLGIYTSFYNTFLGINWYGITFYRENVCYKLSQT